MHSTGLLVETKLTLNNELVKLKNSYENSQYSLSKQWSTKPITCIKWFVASLVDYTI